jgi:hypothetical protein
MENVDLLMKLICSKVVTFFNVSSKKLLILELKLAANYCNMDSLQYCIISGPKSVVIEVKKIWKQSDPSEALIKSKLMRIADSV